MYLRLCKALKKIIPISLVLVIIITAVIVIPVLSNEAVDANSRRKIHFTQTVTSTQDPGQGHETHQLAMILSPNTGTIYDGSISYTSSQDVQPTILHEISSKDARGQATWTVDGKNIYGLTLLDPKKSGSFEFTGAAVALHSTNPEPFTVTVSVDGWIRGQPTDVVMQKIEDEKKEEKILELGRANVPATIPLHKGLFDGDDVYFIITDSSSEESAKLITENQNWKVAVAPPLVNATKESIGKIYVFKNGIKGNGIHGFQSEVMSITPEQEQYTALNSIVEVSWKRGQNPEILKSEKEIQEANKGERLSLEEKGIVINSPQIIWPDGQMKIREDKVISDDMSYEGGQITNIDTDKMLVTFVAHRGWANDGSTIYYIITDATPSRPAETMGVPESSASLKLINTPTAADLYQFKNGIKGSGPLGFQPSITTANAGDKNYSPMWRIFLVEWKDQQKAMLLETKSDIEAFKEQGKLAVNIARPMNSDHIINSPLVDPFQN